MFRSFIISLVLLFATAASADYTMIVPQKVGGGTDVWARIVAKELEQKLGERIVIRNIPGINDVPGFNEFHNKLRKDSKTIMVAHGGNAESFLTQEVDYNYFEYEPIGLMNLTIVVGKRNDVDLTKGIKFAAGSGMNPDVMAITLLMCEPGKTMQEYLQCYRDKITYVKGMGSGERRMAYLRGELNVTRESTAAYFKHSRKVPQNEDWFSHGVLDITSGQVKGDSNFEGISFQEVYKKKWGKKPSGEFYDAYLLVKMYRDALQKSLWMDKGNTNAQKVSSALQAVVDDKEALDRIYQKTGKYEWIIGKDVDKVTAALQKLTTPKALENLLWFLSNGVGQKTK